MSSSDREENLATNPFFSVSPERTIENSHVLRQEVNDDALSVPKHGRTHATPDSKDISPDGYSLAFTSGFEENSWFTSSLEEKSPSSEGLPLFDNHSRLPAVPSGQSEESSWQNENRHMTDNLPLNTSPQGAFSTEKMPKDPSKWGSERDSFVASSFSQQDGGMYADADDDDTPSLAEFTDYLSSISQNKPVDKSENQIHENLGHKSESRSNSNPFLDGTKDFDLDDTDQNIEDVTEHRKIGASTEYREQLPEDSVSKSGETFRNVGDHCSNSEEGYGASDYIRDQENQNVSSGLTQSDDKHPKASALPSKMPEVLISSENTADASGHLQARLVEEGSGISEDSLTTPGVGGAALNVKADLAALTKEVEYTSDQFETDSEEETSSESSESSDEESFTEMSPNSRRRAKAWTLQELEEEDSISEPDDEESDIVVGSAPDFVEAETSHKSDSGNTNNDFVKTVHFPEGHGGSSILEQHPDDVSENAVRDDAAFRKPPRPLPRMSLQSSKDSVQTDGDENSLVTSLEKVHVESVDYERETVGQINQNDGPTTEPKHMTPETLDGAGYLQDIIDDVAQPDSSASNKICDMEEEEEHTEFWESGDVPDNSRGCSQLMLHSEKSSHDLIQSIAAHQAPEGDQVDRATLIDSTKVIGSINDPSSYAEKCLDNGTRISALDQLNTASRHQTLMGMVNVWNPSSIITDARSQPKTEPLIYAETQRYLPETRKEESFGLSSVQDTGSQNHVPDAEMSAAEVCDGTQSRNGDPECRVRSQRDVQAYFGFNPSETWSIEQVNEDKRDNTLQGMVGVWTTEQSTENELSLNCETKGSSPADSSNEVAELELGKSELIAEEREEKGDSLEGFMRLGKENATIERSQDYDENAHNSPMEADEDTWKPSFTPDTFNESTFDDRPSALDLASDDNINSVKDIVSQARDSDGGDSSNIAGHWPQNEPKGVKQEDLELRPTERYGLALEEYDTDTTSAMFEDKFEIPAGNESIQGTEVREMKTPDDENEVEYLTAHPTSAKDGDEIKLQYEEDKSTAVGYVPEDEGTNHDETTFERLAFPESHHLEPGMDQTFSVLHSHRVAERTTSQHTVQSTNGDELLPAGGSTGEALFHENEVNMIADKQVNAAPLSPDANFSSDSRLERLNEEKSAETLAGMTNVWQPGRFEDSALESRYVQKTKPFPSLAIVHDSEHRKADKTSPPFTKKLQGIDLLQVNSGTRADTLQGMTSVWRESESTSKQSPDDENRPDYLQLSGDVTTFTNEVDTNSVHTLAETITLFPSADNAPFIGEHVEQFNQPNGEETLHGMVAVWNDASDDHTADRNTTAVSKQSPIVWRTQEFTPASLDQLNQGSRKDTLRGMVRVWETEQCSPGQIVTEDNTGDGHLINNANKTATAADMEMQKLVLPLSYDDHDAGTKRSSSWDVTSHTYLVDPCLIREEQVIARNVLACSSDDDMTKDESTAGNQRSDSAFGDCGMISPDVNTLGQARLDSALGDSDNASTPDAKSEEMNHALVLDPFVGNSGSAKEVTILEAFNLRDPPRDSETDSLDNSRQTRVDTELQHEQPVIETCTLDVHQALLNESQKPVVVEGAEISAHIQLGDEPGDSSPDHDVLDSWLDETDHEQHDNETSVDDITTPGPDQNEHDEGNLYSPHWPLETILEASLEPNQRPDSLFASTSSEEAVTSFGSMNTEQDVTESRLTDSLKDSVVTVEAVAGTSETEFTGNFQAPLLQAAGHKVNASLNSDVLTLDSLTRKSETEEFSLDSIDQMVQDASKHQRREVNIEGKPGSEIEENSSTEPYQQRVDSSYSSQGDNSILQNRLPEKVATDDFAGDTPPAKEFTDEISGDVLTSNESTYEFPGYSLPVKATTSEFARDALPAKETTDDLAGVTLTDAMSRETPPAKASTGDFAGDRLPAEEFTDEISGDTLPVKKSTYGFVGDSLPVQATTDVSAGDSLSTEVTTDEFSRDALSANEFENDISGDIPPVKATTGNFAGDTLPARVTSDEIAGDTLPVDVTTDEFGADILPEMVTTDEIVGDTLPAEKTTDEFGANTLPAKVTTNEVVGDMLPAKVTTDEFGADTLPAKVTTDEVLGDTLPAEETADMFARHTLPSKEFLDDFIEDTSTAKDSTNELAEDTPTVREAIDEFVKDTLPVKEFVDKFAGDTPPARESTEEFSGDVPTLSRDDFGSDTLQAKTTSDENAGDTLATKVTTDEFGADSLPAKVTMDEVVGDTQPAEETTDMFSEDPLPSKEFTDDYVGDTSTAKELTNELTEDTPTVSEAMDEFADVALPVKEFVDEFAGKIQLAEESMGRFVGDVPPANKSTEEFSGDTPTLTMDDFSGDTRLAKTSSDEIVGDTLTAKVTTDEFGADILPAKETTDEVVGDAQPAELTPDMFAGYPLPSKEFTDDFVGDKSTAEEKTDELTQDIPTVREAIDELVENTLPVKESVDQFAGEELPVEKSMDRFVGDTPAATESTEKFSGDVPTLNMDDFGGDTLQAKTTSDENAVDTLATKVTTDEFGADILPVKVPMDEVVGDTQPAEETTEMFAGNHLPSKEFTNYFVGDTSTAKESTNKLTEDTPMVREAIDEFVEDTLPVKESVDQFAGEAPPVEKSMHRFVGDTPSARKYTDEFSGDMPTLNMDGFGGDKLPVNTTSEEIVGDALRAKLTTDEFGADISPAKETTDEVVGDTLLAELTPDMFAGDPLPSKEFTDDFVGDKSTAEESTDELTQDTPTVREAIDELDEDTLPVEEFVDEFAGKPIPVEKSMYEFATEALPVEDSMARFVRDTPLTGETTEEFAGDTPTLTMDDFGGDTLQAKTTSEENAGDTLDTKVTADEFGTDILQAKVTTDEVVGDTLPVEKTTDEFGADILPDMVTTNEVVGDTLPGELTPNMFAGNPLPSKEFMDGFVGDTSTAKESTNELTEDTPMLREDIDEFVEDTLPVNEFVDEFAGEALSAEESMDRFAGDRPPARDSSEEFAGDMQTLNMDVFGGDTLPVKTTSDENAGDTLAAKVTTDEFGTDILPAKEAMGEIVGDKLPAEANTNLFTGHALPSKEFTDDFVGDTSTAKESNNEFTEDTPTVGEAIDELADATLPVKEFVDEFPIEVLAGEESLYRFVGDTPPTGESKEEFSDDMPPLTMDDFGGDALQAKTTSDENAGDTLPAKVTTDEFGADILPAKVTTDEFGTNILPAKVTTDEFGTDILPAKETTNEVVGDTLPPEETTDMFAGDPLPSKEFTDDIVGDTSIAKESTNEFTENAPTFSEAVDELADVALPVKEFMDEFAGEALPVEKSMHRIVGDTPPPRESTEEFSGDMPTLNMDVFGGDTLQAKTTSDESAVDALPVKVTTDEFAADILPAMVTTDEFGADILPEKVTTNEVVGGILPVEVTTDEFGANILPDMATTDEVVGDTLPAEKTTDEFGANILPDKVTTDEFGADILPEKVTTNEFVGDILPVEVTTDEFGANILPDMATTDEVVGDTLPAEKTMDEFGANILPDKVTTNEVVGDTLPVEVTRDEFGTDILTDKVATNQVVGDTLPAEKTKDEFGANILPDKVTTNEVVGDTLPVEVTRDEFGTDILTDKVATNEVVGDTLPAEKTTDEFGADILPDKVTTNEFGADILPDMVTLNEVVGDTVPTEKTTDEFGADILPDMVTMNETVGDILPEEKTTDKFGADVLPDMVILNEVVDDSLTTEKTTDEFGADILPEMVTSNEVVGDTLLAGKTTDEFGADILPDKVTMDEFGADILPDKVTTNEVVGDMLPADKTTDEFGADILPDNVTTNEVVGDMLPDEKTTDEFGADILPEMVTTNEVVGETLPAEKTTEEFSADILPEMVTTNEVVGHILPAEKTTDDFGADILPDMVTTNEFVGDTLPTEKTTDEFGADILPDMVTTNEVVVDMLPDEKTTDEFGADILSDMVTSKKVVGDTLPVEVTTDEFGADILPKMVTTDEFGADILPDMVTSKTVVGDTLPTEKTTDEFGADILPEMVNTDEFGADILPEMVTTYEVVGDTLPTEKTTDEFGTDILPDMVTTNDVVGDTLPTQKTADKFGADILPDMVTSNEVVGDTLPTEKTTDEFGADILPEIVTTDEFGADILPEMVTTNEVVGDTLPTEKTTDEFGANILPDMVTTNEVVGDTLPTEKTTDEFGTDILPEMVTTDEFVADILPEMVTTNEVVGDTLLDEVTTDEIVGDTLPAENTTEDLGADILPDKATTNEVTIVGDTLPVDVTTDEFGADIMADMVTTNEVVGDMLPDEKTTDEFGVDILPDMVNTNEVVGDTLPVEVTTDEFGADILADMVTTNKVEGDTLPADKTTDEFGADILPEVVTTNEAVGDKLPPEETTDMFAGDPLPSKELTDDFVGDTSTAKESTDEFTQDIPTVRKAIDEFVEYTLPVENSMDEFAGEALPVEESMDEFAEDTPPAKATTGELARDTLPAKVTTDELSENTPPSKEFTDDFVRGTPTAEESRDEFAEDTQDFRGTMDKFAGDTLLAQEAQNGFSGDTISVKESAVSFTEGTLTVKEPMDEFVGDTLPTKESADELVGDTSTVEETLNDLVGCILPASESNQHSKTGWQQLQNFMDPVPIPDDQFFTNVTETDRSDSTEASSETSHQIEEPSRDRSFLHKSTHQEKDEVNNDVFESEHIDEQLLCPVSEEIESAYHLDSMDTVKKATTETEDAQKNRADLVDPTSRNIEQLVMTTAVSKTLSPCVTMQAAGQKGKERRDTYNLETGNDVKSDYSNEYSEADPVLFEPDREAAILSEVAASLNTERVKVGKNGHDSPAGANSHSPFDYMNAYGSGNGQIILEECSEGEETIHFDENMECSRIETRKPSKDESPEGDNISVNSHDEFGGKTSGESTMPENRNTKAPQLETAELSNDIIPEAGEKPVGLDDYVNEYSGVPPLEFRDNRDSAIIAEVAAALIHTSPGHGRLDNDPETTSADAFDYVNTYAPINNVPMKSEQGRIRPVEEETQDYVASLNDETMDVASMKQDLHNTKDEYPFDYTNMYAGTDPVKFEADLGTQISADVLSALNATGAVPSTGQESSHSVEGVGKAFNYINEYADACIDTGSTAEFDAYLDGRDTSLHLQDPVVALVSNEAEPDEAYTALTSSQSKDLSTPDYVNEYSGVTPVDFESSRDHIIVANVADTMKLDDYKQEHKSGPDDSSFDYINAYAHADLIRSETNQSTPSTYGVEGSQKRLEPQNNETPKYVEIKDTLTEADEDPAFDYINDYSGSVPVDFANSQDSDIEKDVRASLEIENSRPENYQQLETKPITSFDYVNDYTSVIRNDTESNLQHDLNSRSDGTSEMAVKEIWSQVSYAEESHDPQKRNKRELANMAEISDYTNEYCDTNSLDFASDRDHVIVAEAARTLNATREAAKLRENTQEEYRAHPFDCVNEYATGSRDIPGYHLNSEVGDKLKTHMKISRGSSEMQVEEHAKIDRGAVEVPSNVDSFPVFDYVNDYSESHPLDFEQGRESAIAAAVQEALSADENKQGGSGDAASDASGSGAFDYVNEYSEPEQDQILVQQEVQCSVEGDDLGTGSHTPVLSSVPTHSAQPKLEWSAEELHKGVWSVDDIDNTISASQDTKTGSLADILSDSIANDPQNHGTSLLAHKPDTETVIPDEMKTLTFDDVENSTTDTEGFEKQQESLADPVAVPTESTSEANYSLPGDLDTKESNADFEDDDHKSVSGVGDHHSFEQFGIPSSESLQEFEDNQTASETADQVTSLSAGSLKLEGHGSNLLLEASSERDLDDVDVNAQLDDLKNRKVGAQMQENVSPVDYINQYSRTSPLDFELNREDVIVSDVIRSLKVETGKVQTVDDLYEDTSKSFDYVNEYASASHQPIVSQESLDISRSRDVETVRLPKHEHLFDHDEYLNRNTEAGQSEEEPPPFGYVNEYSGTHPVDFRRDREAAIGADVLATLSRAASHTLHDDSAQYQTSYSFDCVNEYASGQPDTSDHHLDAEIVDDPERVETTLGNMSELITVDPEQAQGSKVEFIPDTCESRPFDYANEYHGTSPVKFEQDSDDAILRAVCASMDCENKKSELEGREAPNHCAFNYVNPYIQSQHSGMQEDEMVVHPAANSQAGAHDPDQLTSTTGRSDQMSEACEDEETYAVNLISDTTEGKMFSDMDHNQLPNTTPNTENPVFSIPDRDDQSRSPSILDQERADQIIPEAVHGTVSSELTPSAESFENQSALWTFGNGESNNVRESDDCAYGYVNEYFGSTPVNFEKNREELISADVSATMRAGSRDAEAAVQKCDGLRPFDYINLYAADGSGHGKNKEVNHLTLEKDDTFQQTISSDMTTQNTWTQLELLKQEEKPSSVDLSRVVADAPLIEPDKLPEVTGTDSEIPMLDVSHPGATDNQPVLGGVGDGLFDTSNGESEDVPGQPSESTDVVRVDEPELYAPIDHANAPSKIESTLLETNSLTDANTSLLGTGYRKIPEDHEQPASTDLVSDSTVSSGYVLDLEQETLLVNNLTEAATSLRKSDSYDCEEALRDDAPYSASLMGKKAEPGFDYVNDYCDVDPVSFKNGRETLIAADVALSLREEISLRHRHDDKLPTGAEQQHPFDYTNEYAEENCEDSHVCTAAAVANSSTSFPTPENHEVTESGPSAELKRTNVEENTQEADPARPNYYNFETDTDIWRQDDFAFEMSSERGGDRHDEVPKTGTLSAGHNYDIEKELQNIDETPLTPAEPPSQATSVTLGSDPQRLSTDAHEQNESGGMFTDHELENRSASDGEGQLIEASGYFSALHTERTAAAGMEEEDRTVKSYAHDSTNAGYVASEANTEESNSSDIIKEQYKYDKEGTVGTVNEDIAHDLQYAVPLENENLNCREAGFSSLDLITDSQGKETCNIAESVDTEGLKSGDDCVSSQNLILTDDRRDTEIQPNNEVLDTLVIQSETTGSVSQLEGGSRAADLNDREVNKPAEEWRTDEQSHLENSSDDDARLTTGDRAKAPSGNSAESSSENPSARRNDLLAADPSNKELVESWDPISTSIEHAANRAEQDEENRLRDPDLDVRDMTSGGAEIEESVRMEAEGNNSEFDIEEAKFENDKENVPKDKKMCSYLNADEQAMNKTAIAEAFNTIYSHDTRPPHSQGLDESEHDFEEESTFVLYDDDYYEEFRLQQPRGESMPVEGAYDNKKHRELSVSELSYPRTDAMPESAVTLDASPSTQVREKRMDHMRDEPRPASSIFGTPPEENPYIRSMEEDILAEAWPTKRSTDDPDQSVGAYEFFGSYSPNKEEAGAITPSRPDVIPEIRPQDTAKQIDHLEFRQVHPPTTHPPGHEASEADSEEFQGAEDGAWVTCVVGGEEHKIDMKIIEPYKKVVSHGGFTDSSPEQVIIVFAACYLPPRSRPDYHYVMDNLFLYVLSTLDELVPDEYVIVYLHGAADGSCSPSFGWLRRCYQLVDRRLRKSLQKLYLVHPSFWLRALVALTRPFVSAKFSRKLQYVEGLRELSDLVPMNHVTIPGTVKQLDFQLMIAERKRQLHIK